MKQFLTLALTCLPLLCFGAPTYTTYFNNTHTYTNATIAGTNFAGRGVFTNGITAGPSQLDFNTTVLAYAATTDLDLSGPNYQTISLTGDVTFTTSNRATGRWKTVIITSDGSTRTFTFPAWDFASGSSPASIAANKVGILTVFFTDNTDANAVATYSVQDAVVGNVTGPASAVDNAVARFDGTTGRLLQDGAGWAISDAGTMTGGSGVTMGPTGSIQVTGSLESGASGRISWLGRARMFSPSDGIILLQNAAATDFTRLDLGGTTASFPAIQRSTTNLVIKLADGSTDTGLTADALNLSKTITAGGTTGNQTINKSSGSVNFIAAGQTITVTSDHCTANSIIMATVATDDATAKSCIATPGAGSFVLKLNAAATAETKVMFLITN